MLIVGGGASGLYTALCVSELAPDWTIGLITKDNLAVSASDWAQGGIAAVVDQNDSPRFHAQDTLKAGVGLCEPKAVDVLVNEAAKQIQKLLSLGVDFDRQQDGSLALTLEAAHSHRRVLHSADTTGRALVSKLAAQVLHTSNIQVFAETLILDLSIELAVETNLCTGVYYLDRHHQISYLQSSVVVLATGGGAQVFAQNTNPASSTGDGVAIAWRAGAVIRDMEFIQFHPTALAIPNAPRFLISEAVRGEGAYLIDHLGDRFVFNYDPKGELAPRDVVSRAIFKHLQITQEPTVFLDLSPISREAIAHRFPNIIKICHNWQIDIFSKPIPVTPAAHYCMGGILVDADGATSITGLYAVGETASTGVHGANRLASNSLLECFVFGERLARKVASSQSSSKFKIQSNSSEPEIKLNSEPSEQITERIQAIKTGIQNLTWQAAGICREQTELEVALSQIKLWQLQIQELQSPSRLWIETRNLADFAYLVIKSALFRTESRGAHYRIDYPETKADWQVHTVIQNHRIRTQAITN
ncbi:L-aspartate oxidase [Synechococcus sp. PCC 7502]|nr:L-aspartate oxidase [Synechococcus sp. PCC 7502]